MQFTFIFKVLPKVHYVVILFIFKVLPKVRYVVISFIFKVLPKVHYLVILFIFKVLPKERQKGCKHLLREYYNTLCKHVIADHKNLNNMEKQNRKTLLVRS